MTATPTKTEKPFEVQKIEDALKLIQDMGIFAFEEAQDAATSAWSTGSACRSDIQGYCKNNEWLAEYFLSEFNDYVPELSEDELGEDWYTESQSLITEIVKTGLRKYKALLEHKLQMIEDELKAFDQA